MYRTYPRASLPQPRLGTVKIQQSRPLCLLTAIYGLVHHQLHLIPPTGCCSTINLGADPAHHHLSIIDGVNQLHCLVDKQPAANPLASGIVPCMVRASRVVQIQFHVSIRTARNSDGAKPDVDEASIFEAGEEMLRPRENWLRYLHLVLLAEGTIDHGAINYGQGLVVRDGHDVGSNRQRAGASAVRTRLPRNLKIAPAAIFPHYVLGQKYVLIRKEMH